ncbi:7-carboxy-7-deazaguanine synthase [Methyloceanibacter marginalis]|uniref:7-carboxy-7-deazaguanine synthase n=2 Tax=Methyloceanibacter marginalis TaxID=1774971 RepID=A0A1E3W431_9HYPH|nr:7-carboxy-7-deazaguanine synthase [Methyloceanibacter marginalis]
MYAVKEIYYTLQGEGAQAGRPAVFCRFAGCNLWSGREQDRTEAVCNFCDTDFVGTDAPAVANTPTPIVWREPAARPGAAIPVRPPFVVLTGGEPMLQVDEALVDALHITGFEVAIETNGTLPVLPSIDWVCVSPKAGAPLKQRSGDELKLVYPQDRLWPEEVQGLDFTHFLLQPMDDGADSPANVRAAIDYCLAHPKWRLSLQTHKLLGLPYWCGVRPLAGARKIP